LALVEFLGDSQVFDRQLVHVNLLKLFYLPGTAPGTVAIDCRKRASGGIGLLTADEKLGSTSPVGMDVAHSEIELGITRHIEVTKYAWRWEWEKTSYGLRSVATLRF
jgi:hypothetical protein